MILNVDNVGRIAIARARAVGTNDALVFDAWQRRIEAQKFVLMLCVEQIVFGVQRLRYTDRFARHRLISMRILATLAVIYETAFVSRLNVEQILTDLTEVHLIDESYTIYESFFYIPLPTIEIRVANRYISTNFAKWKTTTLKNDNILIYAISINMDTTVTKISKDARGAYTIKINRPVVLCDVVDDIYMLNIHNTSDNIIFGNPLITLSLFNTENTMEMKCNTALMKAKDPYAVESLKLCTEVIYRVEGDEITYKGNVEVYKEIKKYISDVSKKTNVCRSAFDVILDISEINANDSPPKYACDLIVTARSGGAADFTAIFHFITTTTTSTVPFC
jgi:hypothetical protein